VNKLRFNTLYVFFVIVSECLDLNRINLFKICILLLLLLLLFYSVQHQQNILSKPQSDILVVELVFFQPGLIKIRTSV